MFMRKLFFGIVLLSFCRLVYAQTPVATLFSTEIPSSYDKYTQYELGTEFQTLTNGLITKVRLYSNINEGGDHTIRLWLHSGSTYSLVAGPFTWNFTAGTAGWREFTLPSPVVAGANVNYIVSITNSTDRYYAKTENFSSASSNSYVRYLRGIYTTAIGSAPGSVYNASCYFRDIVFALPGAGGNLTPGTIGTAQSICYNASPSALTQITAPTGGSGVYTYQWQRSADNATWTDISGATLAGYSPPALTASTYFRRKVTSDTYTPVNSASVLITVSPQITLAQLHDNITINNNSSTNINVVISGGTSPYAINYSRNGSAQSAINNYSSGAYISTGVLTTGLYTYSLSSVTDAKGCAAQNLGTSIAVTVNGNSGSSYTPVDSLFRTESTSDFDKDALYELGTKFLTLSDGFIIKARLYPNINEGGDHTIRLWLLNGSTYTLAAGPYNWNFSAGMKGWIDYTFPSPIAAAANKTYIISITNGPDKNYMRTLNFLSATVGSYVRYISGTYSTTLGKVPTSTYSSSCYYRDIVFAVANGNVSLTPGTIGTAQSICYNASPSALTQITAPTGGSGVYTYQWQRSADNATWTDISGATLAGYSPPALTASTYFRRKVTSDTYTPVNSASVLITVSPQITLAQLHDNITINNNSSTNINVVISGGTSPYAINYSRNGSAQSAINNYSSGAYISTGVLTTGLYTYSLSSVTDAKGCAAQNLGTSIAVTVNGNSGSSYTPVDSLFRTESTSDFDKDALYELGTKFLTLSDGFIIKARLYPNINEGGDHTIRLWLLNGSTYTLAAGPYNWNFSAGMKGWIDYTFPSPIAAAANKTYIISITNGPDKNYMRTLNFLSATVGSYVRYISGTYSTTLGKVPTSTYSSSCYYRDIVFAVANGNVSLTPGTIGTAQSICYNASPSALTQITAPTGGSGVYTYQWQRSADNATWTDISGATLAGYSPPALTASTYFRRKVTSDTYTPVNSASVLITVSPQITLAQLHDNITINNNSSTNINVVISGGTSPYAINYSRNGSAQSAINNYLSGANISTGILNTGLYTYSLTSATDAKGCVAQSLGTNIAVTVTEGQGEISNSEKALVIINSSSSYYTDYVKYIKPYLDNFGVPYDECNISTTDLPEFTGYAILIFGHKNVYSTSYPIPQLEAAVTNGVGLYSFDPHLFDFASGFNTIITQRSVNTDQISISNSTHYITRYHSPDIYNPTNNIINLLNSWSLSQKSNLVNGVELARMSSGGQTVSLLQVSNFGNGRVVKWSGYDWVFEDFLGPVYGMDDLIWRGIVWAARKPFVIQGLPPMVTMRIDDAAGGGNNAENNFAWLNISNEFGFIPWCGIFNKYISESQIAILKDKLDNNLATASPHAFWWNDFIYFNHDNITSPQFDVSARTKSGLDFFYNNGLKISKYFVPHYYEISSEALPLIRAAGGEFLAIHMLPDHAYYSSPWLNSGPYRINRNGEDDATRPVYYGANINLNGIDFFNCTTEIRDDGGYEWYPDNNVDSTAARGIRHLRRSFNSMVLASLFTHEYYFDNITIENWRETLGIVTSSVSEYNPEYKSMDYAIQYIRAKNSIRITSTLETLNSVEITYSGNNDLDTKCYLFTEQNGEISYRYVLLPQINGSNKVIVSK